MFRNGSGSLFKKHKPLTSEKPMFIGSLSTGKITLDMLFPNSITNFSGYNFRAAAFPLDPYSIMDDKGNFIDGIEYNIVNEAVKSLSMEMKAKIPDDGQFWGYLNRKTGKWTGVIGDVYRGDADITWGHLFIGTSRLTVVDFTQWYFMDPACVAVPRPREAYTKMFAALQPFSNNSWFAIITMIISMMLLFTIYQFIGNDNESFGSEYVMYVWASSMMQQHNMTHRIKNSILRLVVCLFLALSFILYSAYGGALKSILTITVYPPPVNTFDELTTVIKAENWKISTCCKALYRFWNTYDSNIADMMFVSNWGNPNFLENAIKNVSFVATGEQRNGQQYALIDTQKTLKYGIHKFSLVDKNSQTDIHIMDQCYYYIPISFAIGKNSPLKEPINRKIVQLREGGFINKWMEDKVVIEVKQEARQDVAFTIEDLMGAFTILGLLLCLGCIALFIEFLNIFISKI